jgi:GT2 family glycosyltransferase
MSKQLDIILISYNTAELTIRAIQSVYKQTQTTDFDIIVVDNASSDGSAKRLRTEFPAIKLIESDCNLGFAGGVNLASKYADSPYILLLNPDTVVLDQAIDKLIQFAEANPENGIWGGLTLNNDHSINTHNAWAHASFSSLFFSAMGLSKIFKNSCFFNHANYGCWKRNSIKAVDIIQGSFFLTSQQLWQQLDGLDETFFMYGEEADYCYRAKQVGYQPLITPNAQIIHHGGASENQFSGKMIRLLKGKATFFNKHAGYEKEIYKRLLLLYIINHLGIYKFQSLFQKHKEPIAKEWQQIFNARKDWMQGY